LLNYIAGQFRYVIHVAEADNPRYVHE